MTTVQFSDFSSNNPTPTVRDYASPVVALKATEGTGYVWAESADIADQFRKANKKVIRYHFATPGKSGLAQAQFFLDHVNPKDILCLDLEGGGWGPGEANRLFQDFAAEVERQANTDLIIYTGAYFISGNNIEPRDGWSWWLPAYTRTLPVLPPHWPTPWAWQYTDQGRIPGMGAPGDLSNILKPLNPPAKPKHGCPDGQAWWDGHGCRKTSEIPHDAQGVEGHHYVDNTGWVKD